MVLRLRETIDWDWEFGETIIKIPGVKSPKFVFQKTLDCCFKRKVLHRYANKVLQNFCNVKKIKELFAKLDSAGARSGFKPSRAKI